MIGEFGSRQFAAFLMTGGIAALVNFGSRVLYDRWTSFSIAVVLAYVTGMVTAFVLAKAFVFTAPAHGVGRSALIFAAVNAAAVAQTWVVSMLFAYHVVPVFTSYLGHKHWTFRSA
jgi:putative flippase GtrA